MDRQLEPVSKEGLQRLPLRAVVEFAARCARRVQRTFADWNDGCDDQRHGEAVEAAIKVAEDFGRGFGAPRELPGDGGPPSPGTDLAVTAANRAEAYLAGNAADTAAYAERAAVIAAGAAGAKSPHQRRSLGEAACGAAYDAHQRMLVALPNDKKGEAARGAEEDFESLLRLNLGEFPQPGNPVPVT